MYKINYSELENGMFIQEESPFTMISNGAIQSMEDGVLHPMSLALYTLIQKYISIPNFKLNKTHLIKKFGISANTFDKYWKQLKDAGYLLQFKFYKEGVTGACYAYKLCKHPTFINEDDTKNPTPQNLGSKEKNDEKEVIPQNLRSKKIRSKKVSSKKVGSLNNTDVNNTNLNNIDINNNNSIDVVDDKNVPKNLAQKLALNLNNEFTEKQCETLLMVFNYDFDRIMFWFNYMNSREGIVHRFNYLKEAVNYDMGRMKKIVESKTDSFNNFEQRDYDYDDLERKLLGWDK